MWANFSFNKISVWMFRILFQHWGNHGWLNNFNLYSNFVGEISPLSKIVFQNACLSPYWLCQTQFKTWWLNIICYFSMGIWQTGVCSKTPPLFTHSITEQSFFSRSSKHHDSQTARARELKFWEKVYPTHVICHVSPVMCHMSHVSCQLSHAICTLSHVTLFKNIFCCCIKRKKWKKMVEQVDGMSLAFQACTAKHVSLS